MKSPLLRYVRHNNTVSNFIVQGVRDGAERGCSVQDGGGGCLFDVQYRLWGQCSLCEKRVCFMWCPLGQPHPFWPLGSPGHDIAVLVNLTALVIEEQRLDGGYLLHGRRAKTGGP